MKTNETSYSILLTLTVLILFLILVSSTASAAAGQRVSPELNETKLTTSGSAGFPDIYGDRIVYMDWRNKAEISDIYVYDLSTGKEIKITTSELALNPKIYGDRVVYCNMSGEMSGIYLYNLSTNNETRVSTSGMGIYTSIYGDRIVYLNELAGNDIYTYDLSTKKETRITTNGSAAIPSIYGDKIVYHDWRNGFLKYSDIYMYDLSTSTETRITSSGSALLPAIYDDRIVYYDQSNGKYDIYMYDLSTNKETKITNNETANGTHPLYGTLAMYGDRIIWLERSSVEDLQPGEDLYFNIHIYDLSTSSGTRISTSRDLINYLDIYDNRIVWSSDNRTDISNSTVDIYMCTISEEDKGSNDKRQSRMEKNKSMPGFDIVGGITCLFGVFMYRRK
jgi:beta propeller repeat protein